MRCCRVSFLDSEQIEHAVTVTADSLYEAVGLAIKAFQSNGWIEDQPDGALQRYSVASVEPVVKHTVTRKRFNEWLTRPARSPRDVLLKKRLRELLSD
jgi:hypothetical protein